MSIDSLIDGVIGREGRLALVARLFDGSCPPAVFRGVAAVHVNAVERLVRRTLSHVGKEVFETSPSGTHRNAPSSVKRKFGVGWYFTAPLHGNPSVVGSVGPKPIRPTMFFHSRAQLFAVKATATPRVSRRQRVTGFRHNRSARTFANPLNTAPVGGGAYGRVAPSHREATVSLPCSINQRGHVSCP